MLLRLVPVTVCRCGRASANNVQDVLRRVRVRRDRSGALTLEVVNEGARVMSDVAEVNRPTTLLEQEWAIEDPEELRARLVDGAQDSLAVVRNVT